MSAVYLSGWNIPKRAAPAMQVFKYPNCFINVRVFWSRLWRQQNPLKWLPICVEITSLGSLSTPDGAVSAKHDFKYYKISFYYVYYGPISGGNTTL